jgi:hypothetical protein
MDKRDEKNKDPKVDKIIEETYAEYANLKYSISGVRSMDIINGELDSALELSSSAKNIKPSNEYGTIRLISINKVIFNKLIVIEFGDYVSLGFTFVSMDGEYRNNLLLKEMVINSLKGSDKNKGFIEFQKRDIKFDVYNTDLDPYCMLYLIYSFMHAVKNNYTNKDIDLLLFYNTIDLDISKMDKIVIRDRAFCPMGLKLIPLSTKSLNSDSETWVELALNRMFTRIVINGIAPGFPVLYNRTLFKLDYKHTIFSLGRTALKYEHGKIADKIEKKLEESRGLTQVKETNIYINYEFQEIDKTINESVELCKKINYSNIVLGLLDQYKGKTLKAFIEWKRSGYIVTDFVYKLSNIFTLFYNLFIMNEHNVIHNDLHLNNVVCSYRYYDRIFYNLFCIPRGDKVKTVKIHISEKYKINPRPHDIIINKRDSDKYFIPYESTYPIIIDFGRSIILSNDILLMAKMRTRLRRSIKSIYPEFWKTNKRELLSDLVNLKSKFNRFAALDGIKLLGGLMTEMDIDAKFVDETFYEIIGTIYSQLEDHFKTGKLSNPNKDILESKIFEHYKASHTEVLNIYSPDSPIVYDVDKYENFPTLAKKYIDGINDPIKGKPKLFPDTDFKSNLYDLNKIEL